METEECSALGVEEAAVFIVDLHSYPPLALNMYVDVPRSRGYEDEMQLQGASARLGVYVSNLM